MTELRVGMNLLWMVHGVVGGSETYTTSHVAALADHVGPHVELALFARPDFTPAHPELAARLATTVAPLPTGNRVARVVAESSWLAWHTRRGFDVVHHPGGTVPSFAPTPTVLTIHDLQWLTHPEFFTPTKLRYLRWAVPRSVRHADIVVTNSGYVKGTVVDYTGVDPERVQVVPPAVRAPSITPDDQQVAAVLDRLGVGRPFVLYPAITYPHKNHAVLIEAIALLAAAGVDVDLVLTGGEATAEQQIRSLASERGVTDRVHRPGRVPGADLEALYAAASGVVFPSRYEGFGMGVVEAMVRGVPLAAASTTALPEVVADAGLLVDPDDASSWADAIRLLLDQGRRRDLVERGRARAAEFAPPQVAERLVDAYRAAAAGSRADRTGR